MKKHLLLILIIIVAAVLRFYQLGSVPPSPDWDEAALGYNAYSILQTGRDEYGAFFPVVMRSFDDYKPALYSYLVIPFIPVLGLNIVAVRLPAAIIGVLAVYCTYLLIYELFKKKDLALLTSFLLAISPWHIQLSRIAFETSVGMACNIFTALFFLKGLKNPKLLVFSAIFADLSIYVYQSEKVFAPLFILMLILIFRKKLFSLPKKYLTLTFVTGIILILPMLMFTVTNKGGLMRAQATLAFSDKSNFLKQNVQRLQIDREKHDYVGLILDNRRIEYFKTVVAGYLAHFDLNWLFTRGDLVRHRAPGMGILYLWELPFLFLGIYMLIFGKYPKEAKLFMFLWFLAAPIPASVTSGVPHAVRTLNFLPTFQAFIAIGLLGSFYPILKIKKNPQPLALRIFEILNIKIKNLIYALFILVFIFNFTFYLNQYFAQQNYFSSEDWQYGWQEAVAKVNKIEGGYEKVVVTSQPPLDQSYMFFLFYMKFDPAEYQKIGKYASGGFREDHRFSKYEFRPIPDRLEPGTLYVGRPKDFSGRGQVLETINYLNGTPAIQMVKE